MSLIVPNVRSHIPDMVRRRSRNIRVSPLFMKWLEIVTPPLVIGGVGFYELLGPIKKNRPKQKTASVFPLDRSCEDCLSNKVRNEKGKKMPSYKLDDFFRFRANILFFIAFLPHCLRLLFGIFEYSRLINTLSYFLIKTNRSLIREIGVRDYEC